MRLDWICMTPHATEASSNTCTQKGEATTEIYTRTYTLSLHDALPIL